MQVCEPCCLAEVRALPGDLEGDPLVAEMFFVQGGEAQDMIGVVLLDEVLHDCAGFPEGEVGVGVFDGFFVC